VYSLRILVMLQALPTNIFVVFPTCFRPVPRYQDYFHILLTPYHLTYSCICIWLCSPCVPWPLFQFLNPYIVGRPPWTGIIPLQGRYLTHRTTQTQNKRTQYRHPCLEWDLNLRLQRSSERRWLMPRCHCDRLLNILICSK
jgi:hypothetical protein